MEGKRPGGWFAMSWRWEEDPKVVGLSDAVKITYLSVIRYSSEHETDGKCPRNALDRRQRRLMARLVEVGLVEVTDEGWAIPPRVWNRWQATHEQRERERERTRERQARYRAKNGRSNASRNGRAGEGVGVGVGRSPLPPTPPPPGEGLRIEASQIWEDAGGHVFVDLSKEEDR